MLQINSVNLWAESTKVIKILYMVLGLMNFKVENLWFCLTL